MTDVLRTEIKLRLNVEGLGDFEAVDFQSNWGLSEIPTATCVLAVGRNVNDVSKIAAVHKNASSLTEMLKVQVFSTLKGEYGGGKSWPEAETLIFDGLLTGVGYRRMGGQAQYVCHILHWLANLAFGSALSEQSHPANPFQYSSPAVHFSGQTGGTVTTMIGSTSAQSYFLETSVQNDLWGQAIHPFLCELANRDLINLVGDLAGLAEENRTNEMALAALSRFEGGGCGVARSSYTPPLTLQMDGASTFNVANAIGEAISRASVDTYAQTTLWDLLTGVYAPSFMFSIVPQVERALVVPTLPGLQTPYQDVEVDINDYDFAELSAMIQRPLRGLGVYDGSPSYAGTFGPNPGTPSETRGIGGFWPQEGDVPAVRKGMIKIIAAPQWMQAIPVGFKGRGTAGTAKKAPTGTSTTPTATSGDITGDVKSGKTSGDLAINTQGLFDRYAHAMYIMETLRGRNGPVSGKLRFDIAPGSNIRIVGKTEEFIGSADQLGVTQFGTVSRVSIGMNAEKGLAGTGFSVIGLRTEAENSDPRLSIDKHPLYNQAFEGAPIVPAYKF